MERIMLYAMCEVCGISFKLDLPSWVVDEVSLKRFTSSLSKNGCPLCRSEHGKMYIVCVTELLCSKAPHFNAGIQSVEKYRRYLRVPARG
ncbi:MAG: hypothetical protein QXO76_00370 [Thermoproteota archaeon]